MEVLDRARGTDDVDVLEFHVARKGCEQFHVHSAIARQGDFGGALSFEKLHAIGTDAIPDDAKRDLVVVGVFAPEGQGDDLAIVGLFECSGSDEFKSWCDTAT